MSNWLLKCFLYFLWSHWDAGMFNLSHGIFMFYFCSNRFNCCANWGYTLLNSHTILVSTHSSISKFLKIRKVFKTRIWSSHAQHRFWKLYHNQDIHADVNALKRSWMLKLFIWCSDCITIWTGEDKRKRRKKRNIYKKNLALFGLTNTNHRFSLLTASVSLSVISGQWKMKNKTKLETMRIHIVFHPSCSHHRWPLNPLCKNALWCSTCHNH